MTIFVCFLLMLSGCTHSGTTNISQISYLPPLPVDLVLCFDATTKFPRTKTLTRGQVLSLLTRLRGSELRLQACGKRLTAFYTQFLTTNNNHEGE